MRVGACTGTTRSVIASSGQIIEVGEGSALATMSTKTIGWLNTDRLVVAARADGCPGPADVWIVGRDGNASTVWSSVDGIAVRATVTLFGEVPNDLNTDAEY